MNRKSYNEIYLSDAKKNLAQFMHYGVNDCGIPISELIDIFLVSSCAEYFGKGIPKYVCGMSGMELAAEALRKCHPGFSCPAPSNVYERTPEYWTGWVLAEYQWQSGHSFSVIFQRISINEILDLYPTYHEMDTSRFIEEMDRKITRGPTNLSIIRKNAGLSQAELASASNVSLRSIQMYEQRLNDIGKAQARTLLSLAHALHCAPENLLE